MNLRIFTDLLECAYDIQTLSYQLANEEEKFIISEDNLKIDYVPPKTMIYCLTNHGFFELHVTYRSYIFHGEPMVEYTYYLECSLTGLTTETIRDLVSIQLNNEGFLSGCKDEHISIKVLKYIKEEY